MVKRGRDRADRYLTAQGFQFTLLQLYPASYELGMNVSDRSYISLLLNTCYPLIYAAS